LVAHDLHVSLAVAAIVAMGGAAVEAGMRALLARAPGRASEVTLVIALVVLGMTSAAGLAILVRGERPKEFLHFVYAALAFFLIPLADTLAARGSRRRRAVARLVGALVAIAVLARLFATG
jgi:hypothetical protein